MTTAEKTKRQAEIMLATKFDENDNPINLQFKDKEDFTYKEWRDCSDNDPLFCYNKNKIMKWDFDKYLYRVIREPKPPEYIPYDFSDAEEILGMKVKRYNNPIFIKILAVSPAGISIIVGASVYFKKFKDFFEDFIQLDGSPCGKVKNG